MLDTLLQDCYLAIEVALCFGVVESTIEFGLEACHMAVWPPQLHKYQVVQHSLIWWGFS